jgi:hypothetical protein
VINNHEDIVLVAPVPAASGALRDGIFFLGRDGQLQPVAVPDAELAGGRPVLRATLPSLNDAGEVAFVAHPRGEAVNSLHQWEQGAAVELPVDLGAVVGRRHFLGFSGVWLNNRNRNVLLAAHFHDLGGPSNALFLFSGGQLIPVAFPGQEMPGGGKFQSVLPLLGPYDEGFASGVSAANDQGQHAFLARLQSGATAAYLMDADGRLSLLLKSGTTTPLGQITQVGQGDGRSQGIGLNNHGQAALTVRLARVGDMVVLLTPDEGPID